MPVSRAARLIALSREAKVQSETAIRCSLRLLRQSIYPEDRGATGGPARDQSRPARLER